MESDECWKQSGLSVEREASQRLSDGNLKEYFLFCFLFYVILFITWKLFTQRGKIRGHFMRRSEKLYVIISFIVGTCLFLISSVMLFFSIQKVWAGEKQEIEVSVEEKGDHANSWRYEDGELKENKQKSSRVSVKQVEKPEDATAQGIDVSHHQGKIDWQSVKNSGEIDYVMIRCGYGMNQTDQDDEYWEYNTSECERLGIPYGVYLYSYATGTANAKSEAQHVIRLLKNKKPTYPIYYDMEDEKTLGKLTPAQMGQAASTFLSTLESAGYTNVGIYANKEWFTKYLTASVFHQYPKWIAQYNDKCDYGGSYHMWQYTSTGAIDGIQGNVDLNYKIGNWSIGGAYGTIQLNKKTLNLTVGKNSTLKASCTFRNGYKSSVKWSSSNSKIASVNSSGKVTAKSAGKVTMKASLSNGRYASCTITVKPKTNKIKSLKKSGKQSIKITWTKISGTTKYQVYMSQKKNSGYKRIKTASSKSFSYTKGKLKKGKRYYFKVRSYKKVGGKNYYSSFSSVKSIKR